MTEPKWDAIAQMVNNCSDHQEQYNVDEDLWGSCEKCPVAESCPNFDGSQTLQPDSLSN